MAQMPNEIIDLAGRHSPALAVAIEEANRTQQEFQYQLLDAEYSGLRLHVHEDTYADRFFDAVNLGRMVWRGYHPFIFSVIDRLLHSDEWSNLFSSRRERST